MKMLRQLTRDLPGVLSVSGDTPITAPVVESDAELQPGGIFVARRGLSVDGHDFIARAVERGASAVVGEREINELAVPYVRVIDAQAATGWLAAAYQDHPSRDLVVIGVTGTDGKTSTSTLIHAIMREDTGGKTGLISTVAADLGGETVDTGLHVTTPGAPQVQALLAQMRDNDMTHVVLEMTSHGLAQGRLNGVQVDAALMTNLTHEHLDFHGSFENYRAAKGRLFALLGESPHKPGQQKISVVNQDDPHADYFAAFPTDKRVRYGFSAGANFRAVDVIYHPGYTQFVLQVDGQTIPEPFMIALSGRFNVMNALGAIALTRSFGVSYETIRRGLLRVTGIPGRLERVDAGQEFLALVDFAHTPNALKNALGAARDMAGREGRVIVVFGCAGLRDREKRQMMPRFAIEGADKTILTAEDPRTESLDAILQTMAEAAEAAGGVEGQTFFREPDRGRALLKAVELARPGDVVIACGKGHEQSMAFGTTEYPWDDRDALRSALDGVALATLPTAAKFQS